MEHWSKNNVESLIKLHSIMQCSERKDILSRARKSANWKVTWKYLGGEHFQEVFVEEACQSRDQLMDRWEYMRRLRIRGERAKRRKCIPRKFGESHNLALCPRQGKKVPSEESRTESWVEPKRMDSVPRSWKSHEAFPILSRRPCYRKIAVV